MKISVSGVVLLLYTTLLLLNLGTFISIAFGLYLDVLFVACWAFLFLVHKKRVITAQIIVIFCWIGILNILTLANHATESTSIFKLIFKSILIVYSLTFYKFQLRKFLGTLTASLFGLSLLSNAIYLFILVGGSLPMIRVANTNTFLMLNARYGIDFASVFGLFRNSGVFYEPGLFQLPLSLACIYCIKSAQKYKFWYFFVTLLSTFSFIGLVNALIILTAYQLRLGTIRLAIYALVAAALAWFTYVDLIQLYIAKSETISYDLRSEDLRNGFHMFMERPILGYGPQYVSHSAFDGGLRGNSNGVWGILHTLGVMGLLILFCISIRSILEGRFLLLGVFILTLVAQNVFQTDLFLTLAVFFISGSENLVRQIFKRPQLA